MTPEPAMRPEMPPPAVLPPGRRRSKFAPLVDTLRDNRGVWFNVTEAVNGGEPRSPMYYAELARSVTAGHRGAFRPAGAFQARADGTQIWMIALEPNVDGTYTRPPEPEPEPARDTAASPVAFAYLTRVGSRYVIGVRGVGGVARGDRGAMVAQEVLPTDDLADALRTIALRGYTFAPVADEPDTYALARIDVAALYGGA